MLMAAVGQETMSKAKTNKRKGMGSPAQRLGRKEPRGPAQRLDRRKRSETEALDPLDRRNLWEAFRHGIRIGFPPTCTIDFHPVHMDTHPEGELAVWFKDELRNRVTTWLRRRKVGWYAIWVRENYAGDQREHLHLMLHCPARLRTALKAAIERWFPGNAQMVAMGTLTWRVHPYSGRVSCRGFEYRLKQMSSRAQGPPRVGRPHREVKNRHDGAAVAAVAGLRCGVSKTLDAKARKNWEGTDGGQKDLLELGASASGPPVAETRAAVVEPSRA